MSTELCWMLICILSEEDNSLPYPFNNYLRFLNSCGPVFEMPDYQAEGLEIMTRRTRWYFGLYPTQRVADGILFLTRLSVSQSVRHSRFFRNATPLKPLNRISWNYVVMKDIPCRCAYLQEILIHFYSRSNALFELRLLAKMKDTTLNSLSALLKPLSKFVLASTSASINEITYLINAYYNIGHSFGFPTHIPTPFIIAGLKK